MNFKPYKKNNRFYNHPQDNIFLQCKHVIRTGIKFLQKGCKIILNKDNYKYPSQEEWVVTPKLLQKSKEPIITWLGHSTFLIQIENINIITDPVFSDVSRFFFPRLFKIPFDKKNFPNIDIILISHNHKDHLDINTLNILCTSTTLGPAGSFEVSKFNNNNTTGLRPVVFTRGDSGPDRNTRILVPFGNKKFLNFKKFYNVLEYNWGDSIKTPAGEISLTFLPANHWSGRNIFNINKTLWGSWLIESNYTKIYFGGDTAYDTHFKDIGKTFSPINIALMPIGPCEPRKYLKNSHINSSEAIKGFIELGAQEFIPMHWGTFRAGSDSFLDPINFLKKEWEEQKEKLLNKKLNILRPGESIKF
jgi:L-ascorbate metabolism protein UlaG (beta-lactamase superfamily)